MVFRSTHLGMVTGSANPLFLPDVQLELSKLLPKAQSHQLYAAHLKQDFIETYTHWIQDSDFNCLTGINENQFNGYIIQAVTHGLDSFVSFRWDRRFRIFRGEYPYVQNLLDRSRLNWKFFEDEPMVAGDAFIVSAPFSASGEIHPQMRQGLLSAELLGVPVFVDCAFWGVSANVNLDLSSPAIESVGFSLSKCFGLAPYRVGLLLSRNPPPAISITNEWGYVNLLGTYLGLHLMQKFSQDQMISMVRPIQVRICKELKITPTSTLIFGKGKEEWGEFQREGNFNRICLSQIIDGLLYARGELNG